MSCLRAGQARAQDSCRIGFPKTCTEVLTPRPLFYGRALTENDKPMIRPFQPFDTISTRRSAPDATGYIIRESLRTVPSSAVRLTADLGLYRCFMDAGGGKTGHGRLFVRRIGRTLEPNVPGRIQPDGSLFLHRNPVPYRERMPLPELLPGAFRSGPGHAFRIPNPGYAGRYLICCPMHAIPGIPRLHGSGCRYRNSCPAATRSGPGHGFRIPNPVYAGRYCICCPTHAIPGIPESRCGTGADAVTGTLARRVSLRPGHGIRIPIRKTVFVPFYP